MNMKMHQCASYILILILIAACGKKSSNDKKTAPLTPEQVTHLLDKQKFECSSVTGGRCPEGIARLYVVNVKDAKQTQLCSGFLTSTNRLVTNHHCLSSQAQCRDTYISVYTGDSYETAKCQTLLSAEDDGLPLETKSIDFAIMELDRHIRTAEFFPLAKTSPRIGDKLTAWVVDHIDVFNARITELNCDLVQKVNSLELENCPVIPGNSGSPLVNTQGQIVGVIWGSTTNESVNERTPVEDRRQLNDQGYATELKHFKEPLLKN